MDFDTTPGLEPPQGIESNFVDPVSMKNTRIATVIATVAVSVAFCVIRLFVRIKIKKFNHEDWVLILATACYGVLGAMLIVASEYGDGTHQWDITLSTLFKNLYYENIAEIFYAATMFLIKYVLLQQIRSIFFSHDRRNGFQIWVYALIWINAALYLAVGLALTFSCTPREKIWHPYLEGTCISPVNSITASGALNIASDVSIFIIPVVGIWKLQIPIKKKLTTSSVFAIGIFAIIAAIVRLWYTVQLYYTEDITWIVMPVGNWATIEFMTGFIIAGAPYLPRLFDFAFGEKRQQASYGSSYKISSQKGSSMVSRMGTQPNRTHPDDSWTELRTHHGGPFDGGPFDGRTADQKRSSTHADMV